MEGKEFEDAILEKIQNAIQNAVKSSVSKKDFDEKMADVKQQVDDLKDVLGEKNNTIVKLEASMKEQGVELEKLRLKSGPDVEKSFDQLVGEALSVRKDEFKKSINSKNGSFEFAIETKAVGDMTTGNVTGTTHAWQTMVEAGREGAPKRNPFLLELIQVGTTSKSKITWVERSGGEGGPAMKAEEGKFSQQDFDWVEKETAVKKLTVYTKITNEMLEDMDALISEIRTELMQDMNLLLDAQLLSGDGEDATNLSGVIDVDGTSALKHAVAWDNVLGATTYVDNPQEYDVLKVGVTQVLKEHFYPTAIILNPVDAAKMELIKDTTGQYVLPPFVTLGGVRVAGVPVVENTGMTAGKFLIGDFRRAKAFFQRQLNFNIYDQNEDDALKDRRTMTATARVAFRIKDVHKKAFVYGDFATAIAALTEPAT